MSRPKNTNGRPRAQIAGALKQFDILLAPTSPIGAPRIGQASVHVGAKTVPALALLSNLGSTALQPMAKPCLLTLDSFWLVGQTAAWTSLGGWCAQWHQFHYLAPRTEPSRATGPKF